eukprot:555636-Rhodomonas_salina.2
MNGCKQAERKDVTHTQESEAHLAGQLGLEVGDADGLDGRRRVRVGRAPFHPDHKAGKGDERAPETASNAGNQRDAAAAAAAAAAVVLPVPRHSDIRAVILDLGRVGGVGRDRGDAGHVLERRQ